MGHTVTGKLRCVSIILRTRYNAAITSAEVGHELQQNKVSTRL